jgi:hypothetical protein
MGRTLIRLAHGFLTAPLCRRGATLSHGPRQFTKPIAEKGIGFSEALGYVHKIGYFSASRQPVGLLDFCPDDSRHNHL